MVKEEIIKNVTRHLIEQGRQREQDVHNNIYIDMRKRMSEELGFSSVGQNLFVNLATKIVKELNVTNCWICGGPLMMEEWPLGDMGLSAFDVIRWNHTLTTSGVRRPGGCILGSILIVMERLR